MADRLQKVARYTIFAGLLINLTACVSMVGTSDGSAIVIENPVTIRNSPVISVSDDGRYIVYAGDSANANGAERELRLLDLIGKKESVLADTQDGEMPFFSPDAKWIGFFAGDKLKKISRETGEIIVLADVQSPAGGAWRTDGQLIYSSAAAIWQIPENGGPPGQITRPKAGELDRWPAVLPDSDLVLYNRAKAGVPVSSVEIGQTDTGEHWTLLEQGSSPRWVSPDQLVFAEGAVLKAVTLDIAGKTIRGVPQVIMKGVLESPATGVAQYGAAADGTIVYVPGGIFGQARRIVLVDRQGNEQDAGLPPARYSYVRLSPDGKKLAIQIDDEQENIWLYDRIRKTSTLLIEDAAFPVWTPDGKWITFSSARAGVPGIFKVSVEDANKIEQVSIGEYARNHSYDWSSDGTTLAYTEMNPETGMDLYLQDEQGSRPWLVTKAEECCPVFSPDQKMLAYVSDQSGRAEVYVSRLDGKQSPDQQVSAQGGREPLWMQGSNNLLYWSQRDLLLARENDEQGLVTDLSERLVQGIFVSSTSTWRTRFDYIPEQGQFILIRRGPEEMGVNTISCVKFEKYVSKNRSTEQRHTAHHRC